MKNHNRRTFVIRYVVLLLLLPGLFGHDVFTANKITQGYRIGLTSVILTERTSFLEVWRHYFEERLGLSVYFVQRQTYREIVELLLAGQLDAAWLCGYPYVVHRKETDLFAVPVFRGESNYHSYLIVPQSDRLTQNLLDLKQKVFAYSDPDSNSGYLYPQTLLIKEGIEPRYFFAKTFFTWSHHDVIKAVADGVAHGGAVDGYIWETLATLEPELIKQTRIINKSPSFGFPPIVVKHGFSGPRAERLRQAFLGMDKDPLGRLLLQKLNLDAFVSGKDEAYDSIAELARLLEAFGEIR